MIIEPKPTIELRLSFTLNESEAQALHAITSYGADAFLRTFYEVMGKTYLEPYEDGLRSLFNSAFTEIPKHLSRLELAKKAFK